MSSRDNSAYPAAYNKWAGNPEGVAPDFERCCAVVRDPEIWTLHHQCARKRGYGPGEAYCKQHDPAAEKARRDAAAEKNRADWNRARYSIHGRAFYAALKAIADGHNDARGLAQEVIAKFHAGERHDEQG